MARWTKEAVLAAAALALAPAARAGTQHTMQGADDKAAGQAARTTDQSDSMRPGETRQGEDVRAAQDRSASARAGKKDAKQPSAHDNSDVIKKLHAANLMEIESAKIAKDNSESESVKQFAEQMEKDHGEMNKALEELADTRRLKLDDDEQLRPHKAHLDSMKEMKGAAFDKHYVQMMKSDHEKSMRDVKSALEKARSSGDRELQQVLESAHTKISEHHRLTASLDPSKAQQRQGRRGDSSSMGTGSDSGASGTTGSPPATGTGSSEKPSGSGY
jgi:predicted outer membrane protein